MGWKTLIEKMELTKETDPFEALGFGPSEGEEAGITILAVPQSPVGPAVEEPKSDDKGGTVLHTPELATTKTVEVHQAPETYKGKLGHLTPEEHQTVIDWFDKASLDGSNPLEVRTFLTEIALDLKMDAKKRIVDNAPVEVEK